MTTPNATSDDKVAMEGKEGKIETSLMKSHLFIASITVICSFVIMCRTRVISYLYNSLHSGQTGGNITTLSAIG